MVAEIINEQDFVNLRGVHRLAGAILVQAIEDIRCGSGRRKEDAIHWVTDNNDSQFSFIFCCRMLDRDPEDVRRFLLRQSLPNWLFPGASPPAPEVSEAEVETWH